VRETCVSDALALRVFWMMSPKHQKQNPASLELNRARSRFNI
jgi:hypothetical protein